MEKPKVNNSNIPGGRLNPSLLDSQALLKLHIQQKIF